MSPAEVTDAQIQHWIQQGMWPLIRIAGLLMASPVIGEKSTPMRVRLILAVALTVIVVPLLPPLPVLEAFSADWWLRTVAEFALGVMMGFVLKVAFEASVLAGELIGSGMGLGFARMADPVRGVDAPVLGYFLLILFSLLLVTTGGHLAIIEMIVRSFRSVPEAGEAIKPAHFMAIVMFGSTLFAAALAIALPTVAALLLVNLAFGVISRSAPTLNLMAIGFPMSVGAGLVLIWMELPNVRTLYVDLMRAAFDLSGQLAGL